MIAAAGRLPSQEVGKTTPVIHVLMLEVAWNGHDDAQVEKYWKKVVGSWRERQRKVGREREREETCRAAADAYCCSALCHHTLCHNWRLGSFCSPSLGLGLFSPLMVPAQKEMVFVLRLV